MKSFTRTMFAVCALFAYTASADAGYVGGLTVDVSGDATFTKTTGADNLNYDSNVDGTHTAGVRVLGNASAAGTVDTDAQVVNSTTTFSNTTSTAKTITIHFSAIFNSPLGVNEALVSTLTVNTFKGKYNTTSTFGQVDADPNTAVNGDHSNPFIGSDVGQNFVTIAGNFTLNGFITVTIGANSRVDFQLAEDVLATPAPSSALLALAGVPMLGLFGWLRRRNAIAPAASVA